MNAIDLISRFAKAVGVTAPTSAVGNSDEGIAQMVELLNQEGRDLSRRYDWQGLTFEASFTTVATTSQGTLASIIGASQVLRRVKSNTIWDRTTQQPIVGPVSAPDWQQQRAMTLTGPFPQYRIRGDVLLFDPVPTAGHTCYFEYISACWCANPGGTTYRTNLASDADVFLLDEELILAGLEWRWLRKKGFSYAEEFASYERLVSSAMGSDATKPTLRMDGGRREPRPGVMVPAGNWLQP